MEPDAIDLSRKLNRRFRELDTRWSENERAEVGSEAWDKLDLISRRELAFQRREEIVSDQSQDRRYTVMINMGSGRARSEIIRFDQRKRRRRAVNMLRRSGETALKRLVPGLENDHVKVLQTYWLTHSALVEVDRTGLIEAAARRDIKTVNHNKRMIALCLNTSRPLIGADQVEDTLGFDGTGVNVAVCDTGVDFGHTALAPVMGTQQDFTGEGVGDLNGHGTHCGGAVASNDKTNRGIAPGCTLHDYKLMDAGGSAATNVCIAAIQQTVADGIDVTSHSWGFSHGNGAWVCAAGDCVLCVAANNAVAGGVVFVVAAGNEDNDSCSTYDTHLRCPGHAQDPITVAASDDSDAMADFSSVGPTVDGRAKPDVTAPGVDINSCEAGTTTGFVELSGTSMATPQVAGLCALLLEKNATLTPAMVKEVLMTTAVDIGATPDEMGAGRVDAVAAVNAV